MLDLYLGMQCIKINGTFAIVLEGIDEETELPEQEIIDDSITDIHNEISRQVEEAIKDGRFQNLIADHHFIVYSLNPIDPIPPFPYSAIVFGSLSALIAAIFIHWIARKYRRGGDSKEECSDDEDYSSSKSTRDGKEDLEGTSVQRNKDVSGYSPMNSFPVRVH